MTAPNFDPAMKKIHTDILKYGFTVMGIAGDGTSPSFCYTIGLTDSALPELLISGINPAQAATALDIAVKVHSGAELNHGDAIQLPGTGMLLRIIDAPLVVVGFAVRYYRRQVPVRQLVWPDENGAFPGEPGWNLGPIQRIYGEPTWMTAE